MKNKREGVRKEEEWEGRRRKRSWERGRGKGVRGMLRGVWEEEFLLFLHLYIGACQKILGAAELNRILELQSGH